MPLLEFKNISYQKDKTKILEDLSLKVEEGDFISIVGQSGSGKSTFLRLAANLISPSQGQILYNNKDYKYYEPTVLRKEISLCSQSPALFGDTVGDNIAFPFLIRKEEVDRKKVEKLFSSLNLPLSYLEKDTKSLSSGEKQRIALIRNLLYRPKILLLDEVTSALDRENGKIVEDLLSSLNQELTILWITHNQDQGRLYPNKILNIGQGKIAKLQEVENARSK